MKSPQTLGSCFFACASGDNRKSAITMAAEGALALTGIARKWLLPMLPCANATVRAVSGRSPCAIAAVASAGLKEKEMSVSPSASSVRAAGPLVSI